MFFLDPNGPLSRSVRDGARVSLSCYSGPADRGVCQVGAVESGSSSVTASRLESYLSRLSVLFTRASRPQNGCPPPTSHQLSSEEGGENEDEEEAGRRGGKKRKRRRLYLRSEPELHMSLLWGTMSQTQFPPRS